MPMNEPAPVRGGAPARHLLLRVRERVMTHARLNALPPRPLKRECALSVHALKAQLKAALDAMP